MVDLIFHYKKNFLALTSYYNDEIVFLINQNNKDVVEGESWWCDIERLKEFYVAYPVERAIKYSGKIFDNFIQITENCGIHKRTYRVPFTDKNILIDKTGKYRSYSAAHKKIEIAFTVSYKNFQIGEIKKEFPLQQAIFYLDENDKNWLLNTHPDYIEKKLKKRKNNF